MLSIKRKFFLKKKIKGVYNLDNSLFLLKKYSIFNFDESVDLSLKLSNNFLKLNKILKDFLIFPNNYFKFTKIFIFVDGFLEFFFKNLGYLNVGLFLNNIFNFEVLVTNSKFKNYLYIFKNLDFKIFIVDDIYDFILNMNFYPYFFKSNKYGLINLSIGKVSFSLEFLKENFLYFINFLKNIKKKYLKDKNFIDNNIFISTTMGISFKLIYNNIFFF